MKTRAAVAYEPGKDLVIEEVELENWGVGGVTTPQWRARRKAQQG